MLGSLEQSEGQLFYPDDTGGGRTPSSRIPLVSMTPKTGETLERMLDAHAGMELGFVNFYQFQPDAARAIFESTPIDFEEAIDHANFEAAVHIAKHFNLATITLGFPATYRYLRAAELRGDFARGGNSLLVGSGATIHEVLALYLAPPTDGDVDNYLGKITTLLDIVNQTQEVTAPGFQGYDLPLLPGHVTAIEPSSQFDTERLNMLKRFPLPDDVLTLHQKTIGEAIDEDLIPEELDTIFWNRMDPEIFGLDTESIEEIAEEIIKVFRPLIARLRDGGTFCVTVAHGNNDDDFIKRVEFMKLLNKAFPYLGITPIKEISGAFFTEKGSANFGGNFGMQLAIFAKKLPTSSRPEAG